jgi:hypothetical protein
LKESIKLLIGPLILVVLIILMIGSCVNQVEDSVGNVSDGYWTDIEERFNTNDAVFDKTANALEEEGGKLETLFYWIVIFILLAAIVGFVVITRIT